MSPKLPLQSKCSYCGAVAEAWDHVISVRLMRGRSKKRFMEGDWIVPVCNACNGLLSDRMLHTVPVRARWLIGAYRKRYKKLLLGVTWTDEELEGTEGSFRSLLIQTKLFQAELDHKLAHLQWVADKDGDYLRP